MPAEGAERGGQACDRLVVIDLSQGMAGGLATMILADHGARVIKVEPPAGDWSRAWPGSRMWLRGKQSIVLNLEVDADREVRDALIARADVLLCASAESGTGAADLQRLRSDNPGLVVCHISGFGAKSGIVHPRPYDGIVSAISGRFNETDALNGRALGQDRTAPIFTAPPVATYGAAQLAVQGILAALIARRRDGVGREVSTSLLQGWVSFMMRQELLRGEAGALALVASDTFNRGLELCFMTAECSDGRYIQMCARQDRHFRTWLEALGLGDVLTEPRYAAAPLGISTVEDVAELEAALRSRMLTRTSAEWMELFTQGVDVGADPFLTPGEFLRHPQMVDNGRIVVLDDPEVGPVTQVGALVQMSATPARIHVPAPRIGEHDDDVRGFAQDADVRPCMGPAEPHSHSTPPLAGVTILETAFFVAGPMATTLLAEMGARVIKLEPLAGDPFRRTGVQSAKFLHGKESLALDLKHPAALEILDRLASTSDVFVHSFRPGVPERLGLEYQRLRAINPRLIYLNAASYGSRGPQRGRIAFHSTPTALSGAGIIQAGRGNPPVDDSFPDPGSALAAATAILLGLHAREMLGIGQYLETTMLTSTGYIMCNELVEYAGVPPLCIPDSGQHGPHALYRLYQCLDGWIFLAALREHEWRALATGLRHEEWVSRPEFATEASRLANDETLTALIAEVVRQGTTAGWEATLCAVGAPVACVTPDSASAWLLQQGLLEPTGHPAYGDYWRLLPRMDFAGSEFRSGPVAAVGEHTEPLLRELGYAAEHIDGLRAAGVVGFWEPESAGQHHG